MSAPTLFGADLPVAVSLDRQIDCVVRELRQRANAYPRWVAAGRMTQQKADDEVAAMRAVLETLKKVQQEKEGTNANRQS